MMCAQLQNVDNNNFNENPELRPPFIVFLACSLRDNQPESA